VGDTTGDGVTNVADLLDVLGMFGMNCHRPQSRFVAGRSFELGMIHLKWSTLQENELTARGQV
jgi:hypothetical protein